MQHLSDIMTESFRTNTVPKPNKNNKQTVNRKRLIQHIKEQTGGDPEGELDYSLSLIRDNLSNVQQYVISKGETPADSIDELTLQAYNLRMREVSNVSKVLDVPNYDAEIFIDEDEAEHIAANSGESDNFLGELSAPVEIAARRIIEKRSQIDNADGNTSYSYDSFVDPAIITGALTVLSGKLNQAGLKRAAMNKPAGLIGALGSGGTKAYDTLRAYLRDPKNADEKNAILSGVITDVSQLRLYGGGETAQPTGGIKGTAKDLIDEVAKQKRQEMISKYLPIILIGLVVIILVTVLIARKK